MNTADLLIDATGAEIQHRSGLSAPDAFIYLKPDTAPATVFFDAREYDIQAKKLVDLANGVLIEQLEPYLVEAQKRAEPVDSFAKLLLAIFERKEINTVRISNNLPYKYIQMLEAIQIPFSVLNFANERLQKTSQEIEHLRDAQTVVKTGFDIVKNILQSSRIDGQFLRYNNEILTSEYIKTQVQINLLQQNYSNPAGMIIASREQGACPHDEGSGPIYANEAIVVDMFPRNNATGYYADMTRTFVKGEPSQALQEQYAAVLQVQAGAVERIAVGTACKDVHSYCVNEFSRLGFTTTNEEGFTHSTGHGVGLDLHEAPRLGNSPDVLAPGSVVTVEPGLYYKAIGGVRIEDVVVIHPNGTRENLNTYPKNDWIIA